MVPTLPRPMASKINLNYIFLCTTGCRKIIFSNQVNEKSIHELISSITVCDHSSILSGALNHILPVHSHFDVINPLFIKQKLYSTH